MFVCVCVCVYIYVCYIMFVCVYISGLSSCCFPTDGIHRTMCMYFQMVTHL